MSISTARKISFAVNDRYWRRYFDNFAEVLASGPRPRVGRDRRALAKLSKDGWAQHAALGHEFTLYLLRNPDARERVAKKRRQVVEELAEFTVRGIENLGATLRIPQSPSRRS